MLDKLQGLLLQDPFLRLYFRRNRYCTEPWGDWTKFHYHLTIKNKMNICESMMPSSSCLDLHICPLETRWYFLVPTCVFPDKFPSDMVDFVLVPAEEVVDSLRRVCTLQSLSGEVIRFDCLIKEFPCQDFGDICMHL